NAAGNAALGNSFDGVSTSDNVTIGGSVSGARNILAGNYRSGALIGGGTPGGLILQGNYIGTDINGTALVSNASFGVLVGNANGAQVVGNVIAGAAGVGIQLQGNSNHDNIIQGNYIGTDRTGNVLLGS